MTMISPVARISLSLALLSLSILLSGDLFFGNRSDEDRVKMEARSRISESLAIQFSSLIAVNDLSTITVSLKNLVERDADIISAALRTSDGVLRSEAGDHNAQWKDIPFDKSTLTHTQVPIFKNNTRWGTVEVRFADPEDKGFWRDIFSPFALLACYVFLAGFVGYVFFMRRTLKHLDPSAVIPGRVKTAMDTLTEGVVMVDRAQQVMLANSAISGKLGVDGESLMGKPLSSLGWTFPTDAAELTAEYPWQVAMTNCESITGTRMLLTRDEKTRTFMVNSSPILNDKGTAQGALATFNDITDIEKANSKLTNLVGKLRRSRKSERRKNEQLQVLAERDPLTSCYNRRAFHEKAQEAFEASFRCGEPLCVLMLDIDFFKKINDNYGHGVGDEVIKSVANTMMGSLREGECVGRYGGEEFCIVLPKCDMVEAVKIAERLRLKLSEDVGNNVSILTDPVTVSIGVAGAIVGGAKTADDLIAQADVALYASKETGRNKVSRWDHI